MVSAHMSYKAQHNERDSESNEEKNDVMTERKKGIPQSFHTKYFLSVPFIFYEPVF